MKVEVKTLYESCSECIGLDISQYNGSWHCSKEWLCRYGVQAILKELQERFEHEEHEAYKSDIAGMKEHKVWNKAIRILEEYME